MLAAQATGLPITREYGFVNTFNAVVTEESDEALSSGAAAEDIPLTLDDTAHNGVPNVLEMEEMAAAILEVDVEDGGSTEARANLISVERASVRLNVVSQSIEYHDLLFSFFKTINII